MKVVFGNKFLVGIVSLIIGVAMLFWPAESIRLMIRLIGAVVLVAAAVRLVVFFTGERAVTDYLVLALTVILAVLGIILLVCPEWIVSVFFYLAGAAVLIAGIVYAVHALRLPKIGKLWLVALILSVLTIILGIAVVAHPFEAAEKMTRLAGLTYIVSTVGSFLSLAGDRNS